LVFKSLGKNPKETKHIGPIFLRENLRRFCREREKHCRKGWVPDIKMKNGQSWETTLDIIVEGI